MNDKSGFSTPYDRSRHKIWWWPTVVANHSPRDLRFGVALRGMEFRVFEIQAIYTAYINDFVVIKKNLAELAKPNDIAHQEEMRVMELLASRWEPFEQQDKAIQRILEQLPNEISQKMTRVHNRLVKLGRQKP